MMTPRNYLELGASLVFFLLMLVGVTVGILDCPRDRHDWILIALGITSAITIALYKTSTPPTK